MSHDADDALLEFVAKEQRDFRRLLFGGLFALILVAIASIATSFYLWRASTQITGKIASFEFNSRRDQQAQVDRINRLQTEVRGLLGEFWKTQRAQKASAAIDPAKALAAANAALSVGRLPFQDELLLDAASTASDVIAVSADAPTPPANPEAAAQAILDVAPPQQAAPSAPTGLTPEQRALVIGANALLTWQRLEETIPDGEFGAPLPKALIDARRQFDIARKDPALAAAARTGLAWITFLDVQARGNFSPEACAVLLEQTAPLKKASEPALQVLYWSAQCLRKSGRYAESLFDYVALVNALNAIGARQDGDGVRLLEVNAYHGLGTQLIATRARPDDAIAKALTIARARCGAAASAPRMATARACLDTAVVLRKRLSQTSSEQAGTLENKNFAYLAESDFTGALDNANAISALGSPLAWNELTRVIAVESLDSGDPKVARDRKLVLREAQSNLRFFAYGDFAVCELKVLMDAEPYGRALAALKAAFPKATAPECPATTPSEGG
jgi:hypothetical protein